MIKTICLVFMIFFSPLILRCMADDETMFQENISSYFKGGISLSELKKKLSVFDRKTKKNDSYYPLLTIINALIDEEEGDYPKVVRQLEELRLRVLFEGKPKSGSQDNVYLIPGNMGGPSFWRDLLYLVLGRAHYALNDYETAATVFSGIGEKSIFGPLSCLGKIWALIGSGKSSLDNLFEQINGIDTSKWKEELKQEVEIQKAYLLVLKGKYPEASELTKKISVHPKIPKSLRSLVFKIFAEAKFNEWMQNADQWNVALNEDSFKKVITMAEDIPLPECDRYCDFFKAEGHWNLASLYRIANPIENASIVAKELKKAGEYLLPYLKENTTERISEESMFLGIAIAWEQKDLPATLFRLKKYLKLFPLGRFREDVYQLMGDYYFEQQNFPAAIDAYKELVVLGSEEKSTYGAYKASWSFYNYNKKWEALRHMERLMLHFIKTTNVAKEAGPGVLIKETRRDFLLFMAELMNAVEALSEIDFLGIREGFRIETIEMLAATYKNMGRFNESTQLYSYLMNESLGNTRLAVNGGKLLDWLIELLDNHLREGKRQKIPESLEKFYPPILKTITKENLPVLGSFEKRISEMILTIHKEAQKTDNETYWAATDRCYHLFQEYFPQSQIFDIWYHGATRFEHANKGEGDIKQLSTAFLWYQKAAITKNENNKDAAYSALSIAQKLVEMPDLSNTQNDNIYNLISDYTSWFHQKFPQQNEVHLADKLHLEALYHLHKKDLAQEFLLKLLDKVGPKDADVFLGKLKIYQDLLFIKKDWKALYELNMALSHASKTNTGASLKNNFILSAQEASFEMAFSFEKEHKSEDSKKWYQLSLSLSQSEEITLKSLYNLMLLYKDKDPAILLNIYESKLNYLSTFNLKKLSDELKKLIVDIQWLAANTYHNQKYYLKSTLTYLPYENKRNLTWQGIITLYSYNNSSANDWLKQFKDKYHELSENEILELAQVYLDSGNYDKAWETVLNIGKFDEKTNPPVWAVIRDLYFVAPAMMPQLSNFIAKNEKTLLKIGVLKEMMEHYLQGKIPFQSFSKKWALSLTGDHLELEKILALIKQQFGQFKQVLDHNEDFLNGNSEMNKFKSVCLISSERSSFISNLKRIFPLIGTKSEEQKDASRQLQDGIKKAEKVWREEVSVCNDLKERLKLILQSPAQCYLAQCFDTSSTSTSAIRTMKNDEDYRNISLKSADSVELVKNLLKNHQVALARNEASYAKDQDERAMILSLIRLYYRDIWNATLIWKEHPKSKAGLNF